MPAGLSLSKFRVVDEHEKGRIGGVRCRSYGNGKELVRLEVRYRSYGTGKELARLDGIITLLRNWDETDCRLV